MVYEDVMANYVSCMICYKCSIYIFSHETAVSDHLLEGVAEMCPDWVTLYAFSYTSLRTTVQASVVLLNTGYIGWEESYIGEEWRGRLGSFNSSKHWSCTLYFIHFIIFLVLILWSCQGGLDYKCSVKIYKVLENSPGKFAWENTSAEICFKTLPAIWIFMIHISFCPPSLLLHHSLLPF